MTLRSGQRLCALLIALLGLTGNPAPSFGDAYAALRNHKAEAIAKDPILQAAGVSDGQATEVGASMQALAACTQKRAELGITAPCELVRLNEERVLTGREIKARVPRDAHPLFLWRVTSDTADVYLAGSVHALKASLYPLPAPFEAAFGKADTLAVEVDTVTRDPVQLQQIMLPHILLPAGVTLDEAIAPATLERLNGALATQGIPPASLAMVKPVMIATQLSLTHLMALGYLPDHGLEQYFIGRADGRTIVELETVEDQIELLTGTPLNLQEQLLLETLDQLPDLQNMVADLVVAWLSGDDAELNRLIEEQTAPSAAYQAFMERLLGERNRAMTRRVSGFLAGSGTYFVLVGAAHLTGTDGIVELLRAEGFSVTRIRSDETF